MSPRDKKTPRFTGDDGRNYLAQYQWGRDPEAAAVLLLEVIRTPERWPRGYHFWTGRVQKDPNGRRASVQVVYQEDRHRDS